MIRETVINIGLVLMFGGIFVFIPLSFGMMFGFITKDDPLFTYDFIIIFAGSLILILVDPKDFFMKVKKDFIELFKVRK